jgi:hypothetical protein
MMTKVLSLLAGVSLFAMVGAAQAADLRVLSDAQMDKVTAGAAANASAASVALGDFDAATSSTTVVNVDFFGKSAMSSATTAAAATSAAFQAMSSSLAQSAAAL